MKKTVLLTVIMFFLVYSPHLFAYGPDTLWTKTYGGVGYESGNSIQITSDGGYIIAGCKQRFDPNYDDVYLIKTNAIGDTLWTKMYGDAGMDRGMSVQQTSDNGFIIAGEFESVGTSSYDVYLVKTDYNGNTLWTKTYGGDQWDLGRSVQQTTDGGYIILGYTKSFGAGNEDVYLIKTDASGDTLWTKTYGGTQLDIGKSVQETPDGGYIIVGYTESFGAGSEDVYLIKTDTNGDTLWTKTYGGTQHDVSFSVENTSDGGYIIVGYTYSFGTDGDVYLIKTDANGNTLWTETYDGGNEEAGYSVQQTSDGGYIIVGYTQVFSTGFKDVYTVKTDSLGYRLWANTYGGTNKDMAKSVQQTSDGRYIIAGQTRSFGAGDYDVWLIKTDIGLAPGFIGGTVTLSGGSGSADDVIITAEPGNYQTNPISGNYSLTVYEGDYDVTVILDGYFPQIFENVHVDHGQTTTLDITLEVVDVDITPDSFYFETISTASDVMILQNQCTIDLDYQISVAFENEDEIHYDGPNVGTLGPGLTELTWAVRFTSDELSDYYDNGYKITHIKCFFYQLPGEDTKFKVWEGGSFGYPGTEIYSATVSDFIIGDWMIHELSSPISLVEGNEYWVGCVMNNIPPGNGPCGVDAGPMVPGKGGWLYYMEAWYQLTDLGPDFNWNMRAIVSKPWLACDPVSGTIPSNGNVDVDLMVDATELDFDDYYADIIVKILPDLATYIVPVHLLKSITLNPPQNLTYDIIDGNVVLNWNEPADKSTNSSKETKVLLGYNAYHALDPGAFELLGYTTETTYTDVDPVMGLHHYYVTAVYDEGESTPTDTVSVLITGIRDNILNSIQVFPNPATDFVNIKSDVQIKTIKVYNHIGQTIANEQINNNLYQVNTSRFNSGIYFFRIDTNEGLLYKQIIIE